MAATQKIVITGGGGFVGRHLLQALAARGYETEVWDQPEVDITNPSTYQHKLLNKRPSWLVHLAALASVKSSYANEAEVHRVNVDGTIALLETIAAHSPDTRVLAISSSDVYGDAANEHQLPLRELSLAEAKPNNPYAKSKKEMEVRIAERFPSRTIVARPFPHIGPGQRRGFVVSDFASQIAAIEKGQQQPIIHVGNLEAVRDFTDVRDVVEAYCLLIEQGRLGDTYHVASGSGTPIKSILDTLLAQSTAAITVKQDAGRLRPSDTPVLYGSSKKLTDATGWQPTISVKQSLQDALQWWRQHQESE